MRERPQYDYTVRSVWDLIGGLAIVEAEKGNVRNAAELLRQCVERGDADGAAEAALNLGILLRSVGQAGEAETAFERAITARDPEVVAYAGFNLGHMRDRRNDSAGALAAFQRVIETGHPKWLAKAQVCAAVILERDREFDCARPLYQAALRASDPAVAKEAKQRLRGMEKKAGTRPFWKFW